MTGLPASIRLKEVSHVTALKNLSAKAVWIIKSVTEKRVFNYILIRKPFFGFLVSFWRIHDTVIILEPPVIT